MLLPAGFLAWLVLALLPSTPSAQAIYHCATSYDVNGKVIREAPVPTPPDCQRRCDAQKDCQYFILFEDLSNPATTNCKLMKNTKGQGRRNRDVMVTCAKSLALFRRMKVPADFVTNTGSLVPFPPAQSGEYAIVARSTGVLGIHTTQVANSNLVLFFGRPLPADFNPQPGMAIPGSPKNAWAASVLDVTTGRYQPVPYEAGAPFCTHAVHMSNGDLLVCGGDDNHMNLPGQGGWGGAKGCRFLTLNGGPKWVQGPVMADGHWYPSNIELPPGTAGSAETCALVMGGTKGDGLRATTQVELVCPGMGASTVISTSIQAAGDAGVAATLRVLFPTVSLLPVGAPPAAPTLLLLHQGHAQVVRVNINFAQKSLKFQTVKKIPNVPSNAYGSYLLLAIDLTKPIEQTTELITFGGQGKPFPATAGGSSFRIKPLLAAPAWEEDKMPSPSIMRCAVLLPTGKVVLVTGARVGNGARGVQPIMHAWEYNPYAPAGQRFKVDQVIAPHARLYHSEAYLNIDGTIHISSSEKDVDDGPANPADKPIFTLESWKPSSLRIAEANGRRPSITAAPGAAKYNQNIVVRYTGGAVSRCSLCKPAAGTHAVHPNDRVLMLKTIRNGGGAITVQLPPGPYFAQQGFWLLYCWDGDVWTAGKWLKLG